MTGAVRDSWTPAYRRGRKRQGAFHRVAIQHPYRACSRSDSGRGPTLLAKKTGPSPLHMMAIRPPPAVAVPAYARLRSEYFRRTPAIPILQGLAPKAGGRMNIPHTPTTQHAGRPFWSPWPEGGCCVVRVASLGTVRAAALGPVPMAVSCAYRLVEGPRCIPLAVAARCGYGSRSTTRAKTVTGLREPGAAPVPRYRSPT